jgi:hypothetical protein
MTLFFAYYTSEELEGLPGTLESLLEEINIFFKDKEYSKEINEIYYGIVCVNPQFDSFFKPKKMYFSESKKYIQLEFKLSFEILNLSQKEVISSVANNILQISSKLARREKIFNYDEYIKDLETTLQDYL